MKKNLLFSVLALAFSMQSNAQQNIDQAELKPIPTTFEQVKTKVSNNKAAGDTLWSEDFDGGLPACWTIVNNNAGNLTWQWDTAYRAGSFTQGVSAINSTTAANGFMLLPLDSLNSLNPGMRVNADTYFQSCAISIPPKPNVELRLQQYFQLCCSRSNSKVVARISTDNFLSFDEYVLNPSSQWNVSANAETISINVSSTLANATTAYIRIYLQGLSDFFWMVDDIALIEGNGQEVSNVSLQQGIPYLYDPFFTTQPLLHANGIEFEASVQNITGSTITGTNLQVDVDHISSSSGAGVGNVYSTTALVNGNGTLNSFETDTLTVNSPAFFPSLKGNFVASLLAYSTQYPTADTAIIPFSIGDTTFARDYGINSGFIGPSNFIDGSGTPGGTADGDRMGLLFNIDSVPGVRASYSSVSMYISSQMANAGSVIRPVVWEYDESALTTTVGSAFGREVASSSQTYTITAGQLDSWQTFKLDTGLVFNRQHNHGQYVVGWEMVSGTSSGAKLTLGDDRLALAVNPVQLSCFLSFGHDPMKSWSWAMAVPMIRLNARDLLVGLPNIQTDNSIFIQPNPSNGRFDFSIDGKVKRLQVYGIDGRLVVDRVANIGTAIDLTGEAKGIYFVRIEAENGKVYSEKLILN